MKQSGKGGRTTMTQIQRGYLAKLTPDEWLAAIMAIPSPLRERVASIVFWDFDVPGLDELTNIYCQHLDIPGEIVARGLVRVGYSERAAIMRCKAIDRFPSQHKQVRLSHPRHQIDFKSKPRKASVFSGLG